MKKEVFGKMEGGGKKRDRLSMKMLLDRNLLNALSVKGLGQVARFLDLIYIAGLER